MVQKFENSGFGLASESEKKILLQEKRVIKTRYLRIKTKVKEFKQDCRKTINKGRRSGSGKLVCDNWYLLKNLWGGLPATVAISNSRS